MPFFLLRNELPATTDGSTQTLNPYDNFGRALGETISYITNDFATLDPWKDSFAAIRVLRALFTILVSVMLLNSLIALLNLKVKDADKRVSSIDSIG